MKSFALTLALILGLASTASAQCYADYKAKQDSPLLLHYGVAQIPGACSASNARQQLGQRLGRNGWTLLQVMSVFGTEGLNTRKENAGPYYLRF